MSKYVDMIGWDDCPHLQPPIMTPEELEDIEKDMLPHQKAARRSGRPSLDEGAIYPVDPEQLFIPPFAIPDHFARGYALDVGWKRTAALLGALDQDTGTYYLTHEYYVGEQQPIVHAHSIKSILPWDDLEGAIDPAARGRSQKDGTKLMLQYEDLGLVLRVAENAVHNGLHVVLTLMQSNKLKVFNTLPYWKKEQSIYRRDKKGQIVKQNDHLMDTTRYLLNTPDLFVTKPIQRARRGRSCGEW